MVRWRGKGRAAKPEREPRQPQRQGQGQRPAQAPRQGQVREPARRNGRTADEALREQLTAAAAQAEHLGRAGHPAQAANRYRALVEDAATRLPEDDRSLLLMRHQLAHWVGESGEADAAVELFAALLADREAHQGAHHADTELARHQLAHWYGRAGRHDEAVRRYTAMHAEAEQAGRTETALDLLCNVGHWQQEGGDTASALRTFTRMLQSAESALGSAHGTAAIARQQYAALAGDLPFGHDRGHDSLRDLRAAAGEVERSGDLPRAARMYGRIAEKSEYLYGVGSSQALDAWVAQAQATVSSGALGEAAEVFQRVLDCMELRGNGPGTPEFEALSDQRDGLARSGRRVALRLTRDAAAALAAQVRTAPGIAFGILLSAPGSRSTTRVQVLRDRDGGIGPDGLGPDQWAALVGEFTRRGQQPLAFYTARPGRRPAPGDARLAALLGLPGLYASAGEDGTVHAEGYAFDGAEPVAAHVVVESGEPAEGGTGAGRGPAARRAGGAGSRTDRGAGRAAAAGAGAPMPFNSGAVAIGTWREVRRALPARAADDPAAFGPYQVMELVGEGGFGRIHLCQDGDGILVAVKTLHAEYAADPELREDFAREVRAARRVEGRFTVPVVAADTDAATPWMAVPYVAAPSLRELIARTGPLDEASVRAVGAGIATALTAVHAQGIVHLDLKPANVLMTEDGPRVIDFGIAQIARLTAPRQGFAGTYPYASPEQLREEEHFTPASDVFSLGTLLAQLSLGRNPWGGGEAVELIVRICSGEPDLAGMPAGLASVVRRCLRRDPAERPTPAEVAQALLPGTPAERIAAPPLPDRARGLIREHAARPVAATAGRSAGGEGGQPDASGHEVRDAVPAEVRGASAQQRQDEQDEQVQQDARDAVPAGIRDAVPQEEHAVQDAPGSAELRAAPESAREATRRIARDLGVRIQRWEKDGARSDDSARVRRECAAFRDEARTLLGARHPLTLRLDLSTALLSADPGSADRLGALVRDAASVLGQGHPAVVQARTLLALLAQDTRTAG
ncbi:protein kinase [Streptomyces sp. NPDC020917]|uniref:protein kinase domain-containing protein n=1 Tax=Streptomyces sp. NPDC020917 TaxID=3365102 RepID=UPI00378915A3